MSNVAPQPQLMRRKDAAVVLAVSESQLAKWERAGVIEAITIPVGIRAVRYRAADVSSLADNIAAGRLCVGEGAAGVARG